MHIAKDMNYIEIISRFRKAYRNWLPAIYHMYKAIKLSDNSNYKIKVILRSNGKILEVEPGVVIIHIDLLKNPNIKDNDILKRMKFLLHLKDIN